MNTNGHECGSFRNSCTFESIRGFLSAPLDIASLVYFRIVFGAILLWDVMLYDQKRIVYHWLAPKFHFAYFGFEWVHPLPGDGMYVVVYALRLLAVMIAAGLFYRLSCALFFMGFTYLFLIDQSEHLNHVYLACLLSFLMIFMPAHRAFSLDARFRPRVRSDTAPAWCLYFLRFQIAVVYVFGALAKFNGDWLQGEPIRYWLAVRSHYPVIGPWFSHESAVYVLALGGLLFDLLVVPLLLSRRTRAPAFVVCVFFHVMNNWLFDIAIFPWLMLAATALYFPPDWPRRLLGFSPSVVRPPSSVVSPFVLTLLTLYALTQVIIPLRHLAYPGDANWTEEGQLFAWRMKLRNKEGVVGFTMTDRSTGESWQANASDYLSPFQIMRMASRPDMILEFSHFLASQFKGEGRTNVEVRARAMVSLNGRKPQLMINPDADLAMQPRSLRHATWILPLTEPLPPREELIRRAAQRRAWAPPDAANTRAGESRDPVVLARLIAEQQQKVDGIDRVLVEEFSIDPRATYQFDAEHLVLYELVRKPGSERQAMPASVQDIDALFERREHSRLADQAKGDRFLALQTEKTKAHQIIGVLRKMQQVDTAPDTPDSE